MGEVPPYEHIAVAVDDSDTSRAALAEARRLWAGGPGRLSVVDVVQPPALAGWRAIVSLAPSSDWLGAMGEHYARQLDHGSWSLAPQRRAAGHSPGMGELVRVNTPAFTTSSAQRRWRPRRQAHWDARSMSTPLRPSSSPSRSGGALSGCSGSWPHGRPRRRRDQALDASRSASSFRRGPSACSPRAGRRSRWPRSSNPTPSRSPAG
jgi:hypothetical protein